MRASSLMIVLLAAACARGAPAPREAAGPVFGLAAGLGWGRTTDNVLRVHDDYALVPRLHAREPGVALEFGAGYRLDAGVAVGLELLAWSRRADDDLDAARLDLLAATAAVTWHPWRNGLFARLGYGLGAARLAYLERGSEKRKLDTGAAYLLSVGWELALDGAWSLSPRFSHAGFGTRDLEVWASLTTLALAVNFEPGRSP
jgi:hypothetical protein